MRLNHQKIDPRDLHHFLINLLKVHRRVTIHLQVIIRHQGLIHLLKLIRYLLLLSLVVFFL